MGIQSINDIVNDLPFKRKYNVNDNVGRRKTPAEVDRIADKSSVQVFVMENYAIWNDRKLRAV